MVSSAARLLSFEAMLRERLLAASAAVGIAAGALVAGAGATACSKDELETETRAPTFETPPEAVASDNLLLMPVPQPAAAGQAADATSPCNESECPLASRMRGAISSELAAGDFVALARSLDDLARNPPGYPSGEPLSPRPPPRYTNWSFIARDGAGAARVQNVEAIHAACRGCHVQYEAAYRKEMRGRPL